jgi:predicted nuclease of predicted toxin-antitoxin system
MRIFPVRPVAALADAGHDVVWVKTVAPGSSDAAVLQWAVREKRVLVTFDKDFGELARASGLPADCGVVLLRVPMPRPGEVGQRLAHQLTSRNDWMGHFSVIEPGRIRMRPLV